MSWVPFTDDRSRPAFVNQEGLCLLVGQYRQARLVFERSRRHVESRFLGPDLITIETDWNGIQHAKLAMAQADYLYLARLMLLRREEGREALELMRRDTENYNARLRSMQREASSATMLNMQTSISRGEMAEASARFVRNASASTLVIGASFLTGGAALGVLGAGSAMTGAVRYQDTGNVGEAVLETVGTFAVGFIAGYARVASQPVNIMRGAERMEVQAWELALSDVPAASTATAAGRWGMVMLVAEVQGAYELTKGVVQGKTVEQAMAGALTRAGLSTLTRGFLPLGFEKWSFPVIGRLVTNYGASFGTSQAVSRAQSLAAPVPSAPAGAPSASANIAAVRDTTTHEPGETPADFVRTNVLRFD